MIPAPATPSPAGRAAPICRRRLGRAAVAAALGLALAPLTPGAGPAFAAPDDMGLGSPKAKVTVIVYASTTCPHCAHFFQDVWPRLKARWADTGRARLVVREYPTHPEDLAAAGFIVARCSGAGYFPTLEALFRSQSALYASGDAAAWLFGAGKAGGLDEASVRACLDDGGLARAFQSRLDANLRDKSVEGVPALFINGVRYEGEPAFDEVDAAIGRAAARPAPKPSPRKGRR